MFYLKEYKFLCAKINKYCSCAKKMVLFYVNLFFLFQVLLVSIFCEDLASAFPFAKSFCVD